MLNLPSIKSSLSKSGYLLLVAAWLITISLIIDNYWTENSSPGIARKNIASLINRQERDFENLCRDTLLLKRLNYQQTDENVNSILLSKEYFLFTCRDYPGIEPEITYWNTQVTEPPISLLSTVSDVGFANLANGYYVWKKCRFDSMMAIALIPVKWNYSITNEYLRNEFILSESLDKLYDISMEATPYPVRSVNGQVLFYLTTKGNVTVQHNSFFAAILRIIAALLVLLFIQLLANNIVQRKFSSGVMFLLLVVAGLRVASYYLPIPLDFRQFELFDPAIYGSNFILRSLGDLFINAFLFLWFALFTRHYIQEKGIRIICNSVINKRIWIVSGIAIMLLLTIEIGGIFRSMVADSQISFDVINFFSLNIYSVIGFVVLGALSIGYFFFIQTVLYLLKPLFQNTHWPLLLQVSIGGLLLLTFHLGNSLFIFELCMLAWLLLFLYLLTISQLMLTATSIISARLVFWLFYFSVSITLIIIVENSKKEIQQRKHYAETLAGKVDPSSERLMNTLLLDFRNQALSSVFDRFRDDSTNKLLKDSLLSNNFKGYLNKYDTRIYTYDGNEMSLHNQDSTSFQTLTTLLEVQGKPTSIPDLYYYDNSYDRFTYISRNTITDSSGRTLGYVFVLASPKNYKTDALYPELFLKGYNNSIENSTVYSYAIYNRLRLVNSHNDYPFPWQLVHSQVPPVDFAVHTKTGYDELWYKAGVDKVVIIARRDKQFLETITLFSYLFCSFLLVTGITWLVHSLIRSRLRWKEIRKFWQMNIRNQVQTTIITISLLSFIVIGAVTILFFINRYHDNNREKLSKTIRVMESEVRSSLDDLAVFDDVLKVYDKGNSQKLEQQIARISEIHAVDINLYDLDGRLRISSLPLPYSKGILSSRMDPVAYYHLHHLKEIQFFREEKIGGLSYLSDYVPVIDANGKEYAYLNIPYFTSQTKLRQEISLFLVAIINLNAFVFLVAGIVAFFITNRITRSFTFISNRMKELNLGAKNEKIQWGRDDEIGQLILEYNKMVEKLDESAAALARTEREGAWREMARQVAHEIKNPLTPMKLSLQHLQKAIGNNAPNVNELTEKVVQTLVEQIDHLNLIAGQFSQFANIGNPHIESFNLTELLESVVRLHSMTDHLEIQWKPGDEAVWMNADKTHMTRLFTNLLRNAMQAIPDTRKGQITVQVNLQDKNCIVSVNDNGEGIPLQMQSKIFTPNFTTKSSGTGLGLAMCKNIVEQCGGMIWFETEEGRGTTFFVKLPVVRN